MNQEVEGESSLRWYRTVNEEFEAERYIDSSLGQEAVRCRFRLRTGSAGLFEDNKRCTMTEDNDPCTSGNVLLQYHNNPNSARYSSDRAL